MSEQIRLGAFMLESPLSSGGMGTVWRARHQLTGSPVAVKVIAESFARDPVYLDGFEREVAAVSHMEHPRIIRVYDFGFVDSAAERASGGDLGRRSPWLAMEMATRGSLAQLGAVNDFETLKAILFDILDALAHSHARGIIHRDLKPGNVLLTDTANGVRGKLTDFGISHAAGRSMSTREVFATSAGTPWYMAPEQVDSRWRDYGPWTDLYALGCVAYQLASGQTPFVGDSAVRVARQQLFDRPPALQPRIAVPEGFTAWVERLLVKEIPHRFRRAADAAWALHQVSPRSAAPVSIQVDDAPAGQQTVDAIGTTAIKGDESYDTGLATLTFLSNDTASVVPQTMPKFSVPGSLLTFSTPPMPPDWRLQDDHDEAWLPGSGLGIYRLRAAPFVGREEERDIIWRELRHAVTQRQTRVVVIRGGPGSGKSRLASWTSQRAHELGVASVTHADHSPIGGQFHGLGPMFTQYLGCGALDFERTYLRIRRLITTTTSNPPDRVSYFSAALAKFIHPRGEAAGVPAVHFASADERFQIAQRMATTVADRRALFSVIDDAQWGYEALELTNRLLSAERPILLVLTVRTDHLVGRPLEAELLRRIEAHEAVTTIDLEPLSRSKQGSLIDKMLTLESTLREEVLDRTEGSPLFAAELIGDWVRRHVLRASPHGFRIDVTEEVPPDIHTLWNRRVDRVLAQTADPESARAALEVGAALGTSVAQEEWAAVCEPLGIDVPPNLVDELAAGGIVRRTETGWAFQHQMLRESVAEAARDAGRATQQHRVVAEMLEFEVGPDSQLRRALHLLAVGEQAAAAQPLLTAVDDLLATGRRLEAAAVLETLKGVLEHLPENHQAHRRFYEARLVNLRQLDDLDAVRALIDEVEPLAKAHGWQSTLADISRVRGAFLVETGEVDEGRRLLAEALSHARLSRNPEKIAVMHRSLGFAAIQFGEIETARAHFETARDHYQMAGQPGSVAEAMVGLAHVELLAGNIDAARRYNDEAIRIGRQGGFRIQLANHLSSRGDIAMAERDFDTAYRFYCETVELTKLTGNHYMYPIALINVGTSLTYLGRHDEAAEALREAHELVAANDLTLYMYFAQLGLLWNTSPAAPSEWDAQYEDLHERATQGMALLEASQHTIDAGVRWRDAGEPARARQAFALAERLVPAGYADRLGPQIEQELAATAAAEATS